jgi:hypothetical protein
MKVLIPLVLGPPLCLVPYVGGLHNRHLFQNWGPELGYLINQHSYLCNSTLFLLNCILVPTFGGLLSQSTITSCPPSCPHHQHTESKLWMTLSKWIPLKLLRFLLSCFLLNWKHTWRRRALNLSLQVPPWRARLNQQPAARQKQGQRGLIIHLLLACQRGDCKEANLPIASRWLHVSLTMSVINSARGKNDFLPYD